MFAILLSFSLACFFLIVYVHALPSNDVELIVSELSSTSLDARASRLKLLSLSRLPLDPHHCLNSKSGRDYLVDDQGRICERNYVDKSGCCSRNLFPNPCSECCPFFSEEKSVRVIERGPRETEVFELINCISYDPDSEPPLFTCCPLFEVCVSCCLRSHQKELLQNSSAFELCLASCRTNSCSIVHQKVYVFPRSKYCFGNLSEISNVHNLRHTNGNHQHCRQLETKEEKNET